MQVTRNGINTMAGPSEWFTGVVFVVAQLGLALAIWKFRDRGQKAVYFEGHTGMEMVWTLATLVLFVGLGIYGERAWAEARFTSP